MKKLLLILFSLMLSFNSYGAELNNLFGITLYDNAEKYVSSSYINSDKLKNTETLDGYFDVWVTDKIKVKSPYFSNYWLTIDSNNIIHSISGDEDYANLTRCQEFLESLSSSLEEKYETDFEYNEIPVPNGKTYRYEFFNSLDDYFAIQCNEDDVNLGFNGMIIYIESEDFLTATHEFYESGL